MTSSRSESKLVAARTTSNNNVKGLERAASIAGGAMCVTQGFRKGGFVGLLHLVVGGLMIQRGASGHCSAKQMITPNPYEKQVAREHHWKTAKAISSSITINKPKEELYRFWRDFTNLPSFMTHIARIDVFGDQHSHWVATDASGSSVEWDATVTEERPNEYIAWASDDNAQIRNSGWVSFRDAPNGLGTEVQTLMAYEPPGGQVGHVVAKLLQKDPGTLARNDLRRLKQLMEIGELTTNATQNKPLLAGGL
ncbi:SRPBCC family protein [Phytohalomonas tamaricis]|uniref:SRPBCC family protein n=1 Tax=Phytohalomonas tamaricis TaxID=2081032 RepID=UPI000D0B610B|nr:SRPBCC family protein [Phytohalomonas tamaricis]